MKKYRVLILGYPVDKVEEVQHCFHMMYLTIRQTLELIPEVEIVSFDATEKGRIRCSAQPNKIFLQNKINEFPAVDYIIVNDLDVFFTPEIVALLRIKCKKIFSYLEIGELGDISFIFTDYYYRQKAENCRVIPAPYGNFYSSVEKEPKSILLDHSAWLGRTDVPIDRYEMSDKIYSWLEEIKNEFKIYSLVYGAVQGERCLKLLPSYVTSIMPCSFVSYLEQTNKMETFVVTHKGSYNLSVIDMLVRGIRVIAFPSFIPQYNVDRFNIPLYTDKPTFLSEIRKPVNKEFWDKQKERCTSINKLSEVFLKEFSND